MKAVALAAAAVLMAGACTTVAPAQQRAASVDSASLHSRLGMFTHDSMKGRTGTPEHARAAEFIVDALRRARIAPAGDGGDYWQGVPIVQRQLDTATVLGGDNGDWLLGFDFVPLVGVFGLATPDRMDVARRRFVFGGRLGTPTAMRPSDAAGAFVVFDPPLRENGQPDFQLWNVRSQLAAYSGAEAVFVATLDLTPRSFVDALLRPRLELRDRAAALPRVPPVFAVTYGVAAKAVRSLSPRFHYEDRTAPLSAPARNIVAMIEGSDPAMRAEAVVLSAHLDHSDPASTAPASGGSLPGNGASESGSGAVALLALAEHFAAMPVKPARSLIFLWTTGKEQGLLGAEHFTSVPTVPRERLVANLTIDAIASRDSTVLDIVGTGRVPEVLVALVDSVNAGAPFQFSLLHDTAANRRSSAWFCDGDDWHFARIGIPSLRVAARPRLVYRPTAGHLAGMDIRQYQRATEFVAAVAAAFANEPGRIPQAPAVNAVCAR